MNTNTINKKGKKRSFSEVAPSIKSEKQQNNANKSKKGQKKIKSPIAVGNGNPTLGNKEQNLKEMGKQKKKSIKKMQQNNVGSSKTIGKVEIKEEIKLPIDESQVETQKSRKRKFEEISKKNPSSPKLQKKKPQKKEAPKIGGPPKRILTIEMIEAKIKEMESRNVLTKSARRKLGKLRKLCAVELEGKLDTLGTTEKKSEKKNKQNAGAPVKNKQKAKAKINLKKDDEDDLDESDEDQSEQEIDLKGQIKDESVEESDKDEEDAEVESEEEDDGDEEDEEMEDEQNEEEEDDDDDNDDDEEDDDDDNDDDEEDDEDDEDNEDDEDVQASVPEIKKKGAAQFLEKKRDTKKMRYILFVGNLPFDITADELKQHFLTKVDTVISVRIPTKEDKKTLRGIAFVELSNQADYIKGLSLNQTFLKKRRINVQCTTSASMDEKKTNLSQLKAVNKAKLNILRPIQKSRKFSDGDQKKNSLKRK